MGMDIHLNVVKDGKYIMMDMFDGRNREWFNNLMGDGSEEVYDYLPRKYGISNQAPINIATEHLEKAGYFGMNTINVKNYKEWFIKYRPDKHAGWVTTYEKWNYETRNIAPPDDLPQYLNKDDIIEDMHFIEYVDEYDCSAWLYLELVENNIDDDADIIYWFDN